MDIVKVLSNWKPREPAAPILLGLRSSTWFIATAVCLGVFTDMFLYGIVVPVYPFALVDRFRVPENEVENWISIMLSAYGGAHLIGAPVFGYLADKGDHRRAPLMFGLVVMAGSTFLMSLATTLPVLILGRVLQGLSASIIWVVGLALLADTASKDSAGQLFGYVGAASSLGTLVGPVLGGAIYEKAGYDAVFAVCFAVVALDIVFRLAIIEKKAALEWTGPSPDTMYPGKASTSNLSLAELASIDWSSSSSDKSRMKLDATASTLSLPEASSVKDMKDGAESVPAPEKKGGIQVPGMFKLLKSPRMLAAFWGDFVLAMISVSFDTTLVLFVSRTFKFTDAESGLSFIPLLLPTFLGPLLGRIVDRYGARWISALGLLFMVIPLVLLRLVMSNSPEQVALLCVLLALVGTGTAMTMTGLYTEYSKVCDAMELAKPGSLGKGAYAQSYSISEIAWATAGLAGPFFAGEIFDAAGWGTLGWSLSTLCGAAAIPVLLFTGR